MSSWLLPSRHFQVIRDGLIYHFQDITQYVYNGMLNDHAKINKFVKALAKMNAAGFNYRYGEKHRAPALPSEVKYVPTVYQVLKCLQCVRYQAAEGNTLETHANTMNTFNALIAEFAMHVLSKTPEYDNAPWGIFGRDSESIMVLYKPASPKTKNLQGVLRKVRKNA